MQGDCFARSYRRAVGGLFGHRERTQRCRSRKRHRIAGPVNTSLGPVAMVSCWVPEVSPVAVAVMVGVRGLGVAVVGGDRGGVGRQGDAGHGRPARGGGEFVGARRVRGQVDRGRAGLGGRVAVGVLEGHREWSSGRRAGGRAEGAARYGELGGRSCADRLGLCSRHQAGCRRGDGRGPRPRDRHSRRRRSGRRERW